MAGLREVAGKSRTVSLISSNAVSTDQLLTFSDQLCFLVLQLPNLQLANAFVARNLLNQALSGLSMATWKLLNSKEWP